MSLLTPSIWPNDKDFGLLVSELRINVCCFKATKFVAMFTAAIGNEYTHVYKCRT